MQRVIVDTSVPPRIPATSSRQIYRHLSHGFIELDFCRIRVLELKSSSPEYFLKFLEFHDCLNDLFLDALQYYQDRIPRSWSSYVVVSSTITRDAYKTLHVGTLQMDYHRTSWFRGSYPLSSGYGLGNITGTSPSERKTFVMLTTG